MEITDDAGTTVYGSVANPASDTPSITLSTNTLTATTTQTQYHIRITPKSHANMPAPAGSTYSVTAKINSWTGTNVQAGTDTAGTTVTIDNLSPANVTASSCTAGTGQVTLSWTNPADGDFNSVVALRGTAAVSDIPVEGTTYSVGDPVGSSTVVCATGASPCTDTGLTNGTAYHYLLFARDSNGNYSASGVVPSGSPCTPASPAPSDFNAFETATAGGAITGQTYTKLAGTNFSLDVVAILTGAQHATFTDTVQVDLVTGSAGGLNCPGTPATIAGTTQNVNLTGGRGTTGNFNVATAAPNVRVRVRYPVASPTVTSCSTDNFSIRPTAFTVTSSNANQTGSSGTPAIKTGANFNLTAASVAGYDGTPSVDSTKVVGTPTAGTIGGSFSAAPAGTGTATGASFFYSEAGNFGLNANAVYDSSFTSVDQPGDCTADFSNSPVGGKYGCSFGSTAIAQTTGSSGFGRFIPDNFNVSYNTPVFATACGTFSYVGTTFSYTVTPEITVTARNGTNNGLANAPTANYVGAYMKLTNTSLTPATQAARYSRFDALGAGATPALDTAGLPATAGDPAIGTFTNGVGALTFASGTGLAFTRSTTTPNAPFDADIALALNVIDTDGVAFAGNPASFGAAASGNGIAFPGGKEMRFGRLFIPNTYGTEKLNLTVPLEVQYLTSGSIWARNTLDNCTSINLDSGAQLANKTGAMSGSTFGPPAVYFGTTATTTATMVQGLLTLTLSKPNPIATGYVDLGLNLDTAGSAQVLCPPPTWGTPSPASVSGLGLAHLRGQWCSTSPNYDRDPSGRLTLGISRNKFIFNRENY